MLKAFSRVIPNVILNTNKSNILLASSHRTIYGLLSKNLHNKHLLNTTKAFSSVSTPSLADKELVSFLKEEIENESKALQGKGPISPPFEGFKTEFNDAKVILTKKVGKENVKIIFNVNDSLDSGPSEEYMPPKDSSNDSENAEVGESSTPISKPTYTIEIEKNGQILAFYCSFVEQEDVQEASHSSPEESGYSDIFRVDEISLYKNEFTDDSYAVSCDLLDEQMYEKLFNMLEDRGLGNEFASKLAEFSTIYEHKLYVDLLTKIKTFISS